MYQAGALRALGPGHHHIELGDTNMTATPSRLRARTLAAGLGLAALFMATPALAGTASIDLPNGAELSATISSPETGDSFLVPPGDSGVDVPITGTASVGVGEPDVTWVYIIDVSGSTGEECAGGLIVDCEVEAVADLHADVIASGSAVDAGFVIFGEDNAIADVSSAAGQQSLTAVGNPDFLTSLNSVSVGSVGLWTAKTVGDDGTDYTEGLLGGNTVASAATTGTVNVVFLSDGYSNEGGGGFNAALNAFDPDTNFYPFAVGPGVDCNGGTDGTLAEIGDFSGNDCVEVPNPADLPDIVQDLVATQLLEVTVTVDGVEVPANVNPAPPQPGPITVDWDAMGLDLEPGHHEICVTAVGEGPVGQEPPAIDSVTQCETISVFAFDVTPPEAVNELGVDNTHTVTATVIGPAGELAGWPVDFSIVAGPNAGDSGTCVPADCTTDASGQVTFTYTVPIEPDSLGTDTISGTVDIDGTTGTVEVTKLWQDTTPPVAACPEGPNPGGKIPQAPGKGGQGQNQDGFYHLEATDDVWPDDALELYVTDTGTGTVFGPFANGDDIKYTEANGAKPSIKPGPGQVEWQIKGQGDAQVTAVDGSGNVSDPVDCLVPNPPK